MKEAKEFNGAEESKIDERVYILKDAVARLMFQDKEGYPALQEIINTVLDEPFRILSVKTQFDVAMPNGRRIRFDCLAVDKNGKQIDIEFQVANDPYMMLRADFTLRACFSSRLRKENPMPSCARPSSFSFARVTH